MQGEGRRRCLFAVLLAASLADVSADLNDGNPAADSKSGNLNDVVIDSNESKAEDGDAEAFVESLANFGIPGYPDDDNKRRDSFLEPDDWIEENDPSYKMENAAGSLLPGPSLRYKLPIVEEVNGSGPPQYQDHSDGTFKGSQNVIDDLKNDHIYIFDNQKTNLLPGPAVNPPGYTFPVLQVINEAGLTYHHDHPDSTLKDRQNTINELKNNPIHIMENPDRPSEIRFPEPSVSSQGYKNPLGDANAADPHYNHSDDHEGSLIKDEFLESAGPTVSVAHDQLVFPKDPIHETDNEYPYSSRNSTGLRSTLFTRHNVFAKLIPLEKHILLDKIPGAENLIHCTQEGQIHNFWAPGFQCMVCVCLATYGRLRPVCVSCQTCMTPEPTTYRPTVPPYTPPPTPPPPPEHVSCKPLPVNVQFPSPLDPCKLCVCTETLNQWGKVDVSIHCQRNPQCVLPTTPHNHISTPVPPLAVCDKLPAFVPFPHPHDACKVCQCVVTRTPRGQLDRQVDCYTSPDCQPTTTTETPDITDLPPPEICDRYPEHVLFPHPRDQCQVCKCDVHSGLLRDKKTITCYVQPNCLPDIETTPEPVTIIPEPEDPCEPYPLDTYFPFPSDPCRVCKCHKSMFESRARMDCFIRPECVPTPEPPPKPDNVQLCERHLDNVVFPDPMDPCKLCTCYRDPRHGFQRAITCHVTPECVPTPKPTMPEPEIASCAPLPTGKPFQNPMNPCQICMCTERADLFGRHDVQIECKDNPQCIIPSYEPTIPPVIVTPIRWPACEKFPRDVSFPHPRDQCQRCKCSAQLDQFGRLEEYLSCSLIPECVALPITQNPVPLQPSTERPVPPEVCGRYPINTPFDDPTDQCRTCVCTQSGSIEPGALQNSPFPQPRYQILCHIKPECLPPPTTEPSNPYEVCGRYTVNIPFDDPNDQCRTCICTQIGSAGPGALQNSHYPSPQYEILCHIKPECLPTEEPKPLPTPPPVTEEPEPYSFCQNYPVDVPFTDPSDPCRSCVCYWSTPGAAPAPASAPSEPLGHAPPTPVKLFKCTLKPECNRPSPEPITRSPLRDVSCKPLPSGVPFQSPLNPCQICTCTETVDVYGTPDVVFKCQTNPQCVVPPDVTTVPPDSHTSPVPLPACSQFPTNVVFPHPNEPCKLCKCTVQRTSWGKPEQHINCFTNPDCAITSTTTLAPWPPAPPGPLPGPPPHESCSPYIPNQPFQHPWDECQICICREAISLERITIEINCYTKPSCCYEPPIEIPGSSGLPGNTDGLTTSTPLIDGGGSSWINPGSGSVNQFNNWKYENENEIGLTGGNVIGPTGGNVMHASGGNGIGPFGDYLYRPDGIHTYDQNAMDLSGEVTGENWIATPGQAQVGYSNKNLVRQPGSSFMPLGGNLIGLSGGNVIEYPGGANWIKSADSNVIGPTGANMIEPTGGNLIEPAGSSLIGPNGGNVFRPNGGNWYGPKGKNSYGGRGNLYGTAYRNLYGAPNRNLYENVGGNLMGSNYQPLLNPHIYVPNRGNLLIRPAGGPPEPGLWKNTFHYNLTPEAALETKKAEAEASYGGLNTASAGNTAALAVVQHRHSNKMRTKSARPSDNDSNSEDYD